MKKRLIAALFLAGAIGFAVPGLNTDAAWKSDANGRYYTIKGGKGYAVGWKKIGKYRFYFNSDKYAATGWKLINKEWYYFDARGHMGRRILSGRRWKDGEKHRGRRDRH